MLNEEMRVAIEACAARSSAHLIEVAVRGNRGQTIMEVFIDAEQGVTTELCSEVSRELAGAIDQGGWIRGAYRLEVSSPGIDRPLKFSWQYPKHVGRLVTVTVQGAEGAVRKTGRLVSAGGDSIVLDPGKGNPAESIPFGSVLESVVNTPW